MRAQQIHPTFKMCYYSSAFISSRTYGSPVSYYSQLWACISDRMKYVSKGKVMKLQLLCFFCSSMFPPWVDVAASKLVAHPPLSLVYRSAQISAVLLWACSGWNAKLSSQRCSTFHSQSQQTCALWSISGPGIQVLFVQYFWRKKKRERKNVSYFFLSLRQRVTFFDVSTESLVLQHLLPDAVIESPMSNRKRNKCFIELELSLVMAGRREGGMGGLSRLLCGCLWVPVH